MMNIIEINKRIKQRPPFQMVERVLDVVPGESVTALKNVSVNEPYFMGHFPDAPIMPGVLVIESAAQACSLAIEADGTDESTIYVLLKVKDFKFVKPIIPGDTMIINCKKTMGSAGLYSFAVTISVNDKVRAKGELMFTAVDKETIYAE
ncbi:MAG TPA: beta-hydroxyacyl-ACP dehydratase [Butyrivibrio sp.]|nr:3-hydroxyacyl-ACP dehydratase FabZ [Butyrivibrio crossotus]MBS6453021.1 3-hydroxyacyl-ACP dehydratase FabZ [Butyrivibrio sp.]HAI91098.1 beta-hydroxyacyl-ACP dehydratase [Butyrivibrio sp.]HAX08129.1 beta-hydroxyacyl-ACP dehydratase [Butyrivibrio sp.]